MVPQQRNALQLLHNSSVIDVSEHVPVQYFNGV